MERMAVLNSALREQFEQSFARYRVILFSAPCGFGKTAAAEALLANRTTCVFSAAQPEFLDAPVPDDCDTLLIDELEQLNEPEQQQAFCVCIRENPDKHFVLLSRGVLPGWLMPFQFTGLLTVFGAESLMLDRETARTVLERDGAAVSDGELTAILRDTKGYPLALCALGRHLAGGEAYTQAVYDAVQRELFHYLEDGVFLRFEPPMRRLLLQLAPFEGFDPELAKLVSGDSHVGELLYQMLHQTTMLVTDGVEHYQFWPLLRRFLLWELQQTETVEEQNDVYSRAGLYYELRDDYARALDCYSKCGNHRKVSELLVKNAELHPGVGHYYDMEDYYYALPESEILRSPTLLCGMSMLTALNLDYETSEQWYAKLQSYAAGLKKSDAEYRAVRGKLAFLDISLPQRGSKGLIEIIVSVFRVLTDKQIKIPAFSVTSTLPSLMNGGKDFCLWSKQDDLLYKTMRIPVEAVLGKDGVGLADCAICESKFEKGEDVTERLLALVGRLTEIHRKGTPDMEFAITGLLARQQTAQGKADAALTTLNDLREVYADAGQTRFLPNMDAMRCRLWLRLGMTDEVERWYREKAPTGGHRLRAMWRYQYMTAAMVRLAKEDYDGALLVLAPLQPYCRRCARTMDELHLRLLTAICHFRQKNEQWRQVLNEALETACEYQFIQPVAQYGAAVLPLLTACAWDGDAVYFDRLLTHTRRQAVHYPDFLRPAPGLREPLTAAEKQVLKLICHNRSNQEIADMLGVKLATVKTHVLHILQKLGVKRRSEAKDAAKALHLI